MKLEQYDVAELSISELFMKYGRQEQKSYPKICAIKIFVIDLEESVWL